MDDYNAFFLNYNAFIYQQNQTYPEKPKDQKSYQQTFLIEPLVYPKIGVPTSQRRLIATRIF